MFLMFEWVRLAYMACEIVFNSPETVCAVWLLHPENGSDSKQNIEIVKKVNKILKLLKR